MDMTISLETQIILIATYVLVKLLCKFIISLMSSFNFLAALFLISHSPHVRQINVVYLEALLPSSQGKLLCLHSGSPPLSLANSLAPVVSHLLSTPRLWLISIHLGQEVRGPLSQPGYHRPELWVQHS